MGEASAALHLGDVVFRYYETGKRNILDHVSLDIASGGITVLMGSSGCGKSTLAAVAAGLYPENGGYLEQGEILLYGKPVQEMNQQQRAAYLTEMFQNPDLQFCMDTLRREMQFCMENICVPPEQMDERIMQAARSLGMEHLLDRKLQMLSGGEKQKAALCCLYVMESRCILLDEPFANIDRTAAREILGMLECMKAQGRTIVAIDHQLDVWKDAADEIIVLGTGGQVLKRGINRSNLEESRLLFEQEGLFYPGQAEDGNKDLGQAEQSVAVELQGVSIFIEESGTKKRWWKSRKKDPICLLEYADARFLSGQMTAVLGPSGSGKTTTFLSVLKQHPYEGTIRVHGTDLSQIRKQELFRQIGIVFQSPANQFITQNVREEVLQSIRIWEPETGEEDCLKKADRLLSDYGLKQYQRYSPYMLSQGQQRRLAVLSVLSGRQQILFLDEPTYGQDYRSTMAIMEQLRKKVREEHLTVVFITHDEELARLWADRIYRMKDRKLVEEEGLR